MMIHDFELQAEAFHQEMYREYYLAEAGLKEHLEITPIYERHAHLFDERLVRELLASADDRQEQYVTEWVTLEYLENVVKWLTELVTNEMRKATVEWDGQRVSYHDLRAMMANEPDLLRRHQLDELERKITATANEERAARLRSLQDKARELGFESYAGLCDQLRGLGLITLTQQTQALLDNTREVFFHQLELYLHDMRVPVGEARSCDILALFRGRQFDPLFPQESMMPALTSTLLGLGIDTARQGNLEVDTEARALKTPRAFCAPIRIPEEVKLVTKPIGGPDDYASLLHEAGHAEHFVHVDPGLPFSYKRLGDNSVTEGYAFLFQYLLLNKGWIRRSLDIEDSAEYLRLERFRKLWLLRRYASKLLYERKLHTQLDGAEREYVNLLGGALGVAISAENYLADTDDALYCAQYLRAWIFEAQLRRRLEDQFGPEWFAARDAGQYLVSLWKRGQELRAEELAREMGYDGLQPEYLMAELVEHEDD
jgi:hypothetical protein